jgi:hypothetical protein
LGQILDPGFIRRDNLYSRSWVWDGKTQRVWTHCHPPSIFSPPLPPPPLRPTPVSHRTAPPFQARTSRGRRLVSGTPFSFPSPRPAPPRSFLFSSLKPTESAHVLRPDTPCSPVATASRAGRPPPFLALAPCKYLSPAPTGGGRRCDPRRPDGSIRRGEAPSPDPIARRVGSIRYVPLLSRGFDPARLVLSLRRNLRVR